MDPTNLRVNGIAGLDEEDEAGAGAGQDGAVRLRERTRDAQYPN